MKKRSIFATLLAGTMAISMMSITAFAAEEDTALNIDSTAKTITVDDATDMRWLSTYDGSISGMPATFEGWTINITNNIDLEDEAWTPIADFRGKMVGVTNVEGGTITISNLKVDVTTEGAGLCAKSGGGARFENLTISESEIKTTAPYAGAFIGNGFTSSFDNCHTLNTSVSGDRFVGGIVGFNYGSIIDCSVTATNNKTIITALEGKGILDNAGDNAGGIVGQIGEGEFLISNCVVNGISVRGSRQIGGIAGMAMYGNTVTGCNVSNTTLYASLSSGDIAIGTQSRTAAVGGVVGQIQPGNSIITISDNTVGPNMTISRGGRYATRYCGWVLGDATRASDAAAQYKLEENHLEFETDLPLIGKR